jgi:penicillin V acylase-like amidase (Ntn superfamily)
MRYFVLVLIAILILQPRQSLACSVFAASDSRHVAANYDWTERGGLAFVGQSGVKKIAWPAQDGSYSWLSRFATITTSQWGRDFPVQGMNAAGLVGFALNAPAVYPTSQDKPHVSELQWLQVQLDSYQTIQEVEQNTHNLNILKLSGSLHYFFCDQTLECMVVEFRDGHPQTTRLTMQDPRALTNSPIENALSMFDSFEQSTTSDDPKLPQGYGSIARFIRAGWYSLHSSEDQSMTLWTSLRDLADLKTTQWHAIFDVKTLQTTLAWSSSKSITDPPEQRISIKSSEWTTHCGGKPRFQSRPIQSEGEGWKQDSDIANYATIRKAAATLPEYTDELIKSIVSLPVSYVCDESTVTNTETPH